MSNKENVRFLYHQINLNTFARDEQNTPDFGEKSLMIAVIISAIEDLEYLKVSRSFSFVDGHTKRTRRLGLDAYEWFFIDNFDWPFSFVMICQYFDIEPSKVREIVKKQFGVINVERERKGR